MKQRYRIFCAAVGQHYVGHKLVWCDWKGGYRKALTEEAAKETPCPRCGGPVIAVPAPEGTRFARRHT